MEVVVTKVLDGYNVHVKSNPGVWEHGTTEKEAIGKLAISVHFFNVEYAN